MFCLILPSPALGELSAHTYLWEFVRWSLQLAFIISNTSQIVCWCTGGPGKVVWQHLLKLFTWWGSTPRFLLAFCLLPSVGLPLQCPKLTRNKDAPFLLGCSVLPLPFGMMYSFVMFGPFCARPTSLPALNLAARDPSAEEQVTVTPWEGQNLSQTNQKFCTRF